MQGMTDDKTITRATVTTAAATAATTAAATAAATAATTAATTGSAGGWRRRSTGFKVTSKGALYLEFTNDRVIALRPDPARCWTARIGPEPRWIGLRDPPLELGERIREVRAIDAIAAGVPVAGAPVAGTPVAGAPAAGTAVAGTAVVGVPDGLQHQPYFVRRRDTVRKLLEHIPVEVQDVVARVHMGSWALYRLLHSAPAALELCATDDGLRVAYLLSQAHFLLPADSPAWRRSLDVARRQLPRKRRDMVGRFGLPPTTATLHVLSKIPTAHLGGPLLVELRALLHDEVLRQKLSHLPVVSRSVVATLSSPWFWQVGPAFLLDLALHDDVEPGAVATLLRDVNALAAQLDRRLPVCTSRAQLEAIHDDLVERARQVLTLSSVPLPPQPSRLLPHETGWVQPLPSMLALVDEGAQMHHCLGTLVDHRSLAEEGRFCAFRLHWPTRLTLALARHHTGRWQIYDLKGVANAPAPDEAWQWAREFLGRWNVAPSPTATATTTTATTTTPPTPQPSLAMSVEALLHVRHTVQMVGRPRLP